MMHWVFNFDVPATVTTKCESKLKSTLFRELNSLLDTNWILMMADHPQANGLVERLHQQLMTAIMAQLDPSRWSDNLPLMMLSTRPTLNVDINCTAADLAFGNTLRLPGGKKSP
ncbi:unnamed protein product [Schistocephalus solidus]|uniref:Integrase catalytic domain-containing protein n=1 Tax=Schistocephalus solidus TaxID=70667 RepID=A0A183SF12_SCHSO|nr:unnamed protein product [Schistocephalus solidus]